MTIRTTHKTNRSRDRLIWGILLLALTAGLLLRALCPGASFLGGIPVWKWILTAVLVYLIIDKLFFSRTLSDALMVTLPLGLLYTLLQKNVAALAGADHAPLGTWPALGITVLLTLSLQLIAGGGTVRVFHRVGDEDEETFEDDGDGTANHLRAGTAYLDLSDRHDFSASNRLGALEIFFQNADLCTDDTVTLHLRNELGETTVHVPADRRVECLMSNSLGEIEVEEAPAGATKVLVLQGTNSLGQVTVKY